MAKILLALRDVVVRYDDRTALQVPSLDVSDGEVLGVLGPNGAGKTTLLRVMGLLLRPTTGSVLFLNQEVTRKNSLSIRRRIANVFQEPLLLNTTVYENAALGLKLRGFKNREIQKRVQPWLERFGIAGLADRPARTLSGGEAQRTSLVRAFALDPKVLLLDEPFSSLDQPTREELFADLQGIVSATGVTAVFVTHEREEARTLSNRIGVLVRGKLLQLGSRNEVFSHPTDNEVAKLVGFHDSSLSTSRMRRHEA